MKKKKILFLCSNMHIGGFQKSLISLLSYFDYEKYDIDLLLLEPNGIFMDLIPEKVHILCSPIDPLYFYSCKTAIFAMLKQKNFYAALIRFISGVFWIKNKSIGASIMMKVVPKLEKNYDVAIDYNGQHLLYYLVDKVTAKKKISYFHSDYRKWSYYEKMDRKYYNFVDAIVTVSDECVESIKNIFPEYKYKIYCIENIISEKTVNLFPLNSNDFCDDYVGIRLVTVGRVCKDKGFDFACEALKLLLENGYDVRWYMIGSVENQIYCKNLIEKCRLVGKMCLLGATNNPYDYMRNADIVVHPSRFEGKAVAIEEAKMLRKPIVATDFSTVKDQIVDGQTGIIVEMNGYALYEGIKRILIDEKLRDFIIQKQKQIVRGNEREINKLYWIMGDIDDGE